MSVPRADANLVDAVIGTRRAVRRFLPDPVPQHLVEEILAAASFAPSAINTQPWRVRVLAGAARERLCESVLAAYDAGGPRPEEPTTWFGPYQERRRVFGARFYGHPGIGRGDVPRLRAQQRRNFSFYDAPVGLMFSIDRRLPSSSWLDCGMFLQNVMLAAAARGLATCPQGCWNDFPDVVARELALQPQERLLCGMALGHPDAEAPENDLDMGREPVAAFATFTGFD